MTLHCYAFMIVLYTAGVYIKQVLQCIRDTAAFNQCYIENDIGIKNQLCFLSLCRKNFMMQQLIMSTEINAAYQQISHSFAMSGMCSLFRVSATPGNTGNLLEFEIPSGNAVNLLEFC